MRRTDMAQGIGADQFIVVHAAHVRGAQGSLPTKTFVPVWVQAAGPAARTCLHKLRPSDLIRRVQYHINLCGREARRYLRFIKGDRSGKSLVYFIVQPGEMLMFIERVARSFL